MAGVGEARRRTVIDSSSTMLDQQTFKRSSQFVIESGLRFLNKSISICIFLMPSVLL